jgi:hypothetical protein
MMAYNDKQGVVGNWGYRLECRRARPMMLAPTSPDATLACGRHLVWAAYARAASKQ